MNNLINHILFKDDIEEEVWAPITEHVIPGIKPYYHISTHGRVYSTKSNIFLSLFLDRDGYERFGITLHNGSMQISVHRAVLLVFKYVHNHAELQINHIDGIKRNNFLYNLEWCTSGDNIRHAITNGLLQVPIGEDANNASITNDQARQICEMLYSQSYRNNEIAEIIGCTPNIVNNISAGLTWKKYYIVNISYMKVGGYLSYLQMMNYIIYVNLLRVQGIKI